MDKLAKRCFCAVLALLAAAALCFSLYRWDNKYTYRGNQPLAGMLFVDEADRENTPIRFLWNGWRFCPDRMLTPDELSGLDGSQLFTLKIGEHKNFAFANRDNTPHGCGSYILTLSLPKDTHTYAIELPEIFSAYKFYVGDKLLAQMGDVSEQNYRPLIKNRIVTFSASGVTRLLLTVRDESHIYSGLIYPPMFGEPEAVSGMMNWRLFFSAITVAGTMLFAALAFWVAIKAHHQQNTLLFFLLSINTTVFIAYSVIHNLLQTAVWPWYCIEVAGGYASALLIVILQNRMCDIPLKLRKLSACAAGVFCAMMLGYCAFAPRLTERIVSLFSIMIPAFKIATAAWLLGSAVYALYCRKSSTELIFCADIFYAAMLIFDRLLPAYEPIMGGWFQEWGSLALIATLGAILLHDVAAGYRLSLTFKEERRHMERQIEIQQQHYRQIYQKVEESRRMRHDFRQHLHTIVGLVGNDEAQLEYINKFISVNESARPESYFNIPSIDALLLHYLNIARNDGIEVKVQVGVPDDIVISDEITFCTILGNLMENALEACQRLSEGKRFIRFFARMQGGRLMLRIENSFDGGLRKSKNGFYSRKHEGEGIGVVSITKMAQKLGGGVDFMSDDGVFSVLMDVPVSRKAALPVTTA